MAPRSHRNQLGLPIPLQPRPQLNRTRAQITIGFEQKIITEMETKGKAAVLSQYRNLNHRQLEDWQADKINIMRSDPSSFRVSGAGRKPLSTDLEESLCDEILDKRSRLEQVTVNWVKARALTLAALNNVNLQASDMWVRGFFKRKNMSLRAANLASITQEAAAEKATSFLHMLQDLMGEFKINEDKIWNFDETALLLIQDKQEQSTLLETKRF
ncbi:hypothetical protein GEMRC1_010652 [Eukaryota sp. GEM-RC1]